MDQTIQFNIIMLNLYNYWKYVRKLNFIFKYLSIVIEAYTFQSQFSYSFLYHAKFGQNMCLKMRIKLRRYILCGQNLVHIM